MIQDIRLETLRIGTRKLYHMLLLSLKEKKVGSDKLFDILRANHLLIKPVRSYHVTTNSRHRFQKHKNLVENMEATRPEKCISLVTDAYSKKIMGYDLFNSLDTQGSLNVLKMANRNRLYREVLLIHHSDRGIQYCFNTYQKLKRYHITPSMTESYAPYANVVAEWINGILKQEFLLEELNLPLCDMKQVI
uniref:transposase n=1 Tax=Bacteroides ovatus TaxID=28116 RepID=UPI004028C9FB